MTTNIVSHVNVLWCLHYLIKPRLYIRGIGLYNALFSGGKGQLVMVGLYVPNDSILPFLMHAFCSDLPPGVCLNVLSHRVRHGTARHGIRPCRRCFHTEMFHIHCIALRRRDAPCRAGSCTDLLRCRLSCSSWSLRSLIASW